MAKADIAQRLTNVLLFASLLSLLPLATVLVWFNYAATILISNGSLRYSLRQRKGFKPETVLISGASSFPGLRIARAFHDCGHHVIGVDLKHSPLGSLAAWSRAYAKAYSLQQLSAVRDGAAYGYDLVKVIRKHSVSIWIDCQPALGNDLVAEVRSLVEKQTAVRQLLMVDKAHAHHFSSRMAYFDLLKQINLPVPESHEVRSRNEIHNVLNDGRGKKKYLLGTANGDAGVNAKSLFPRRTLSQTYRDVSMVRIANETPLVLQEYVDSDLKFETLSIIVSGKLKGFKARVLGAQRGLRDSSPITKALTQHAQMVATGLGPCFSGHLSQQFCMLENVTGSGVVLQIQPLQAQPVVNDLILHFLGRLGTVELMLAYLPKFESRTNDEKRVSLDSTHLVHASDRLTQQQAETGVYHFVDAGRELVLQPLISVLLLQGSLASLAKSASTFVMQIAYCHDAIYSFSDPLPAFWHYFLRTPFTLLLGDARQQST